MPTDILTAAAVAALAGLVRGFAGVGSGLIMAPFFVHIFGPVETVGVIVLMEIVVTAQLIPSVRHDIDWKVIAPMGAAAAVTMPLGSWLLVSLDRTLLQQVVGGVVVASALILMTGWRYTGEKPLPATIGVGMTSGILMALTSLGNPPVMLYLLSSRDSAQTNRANFTGYFALTLAALVTIMLVSRLITFETLVNAATLVVPFMATAWIGGRLFRKSNETIYRRVAFAIILASGLYGLLR